ncbi:MAG: ATP-binding protein [Chitinophagales bacterium]|nr:ATP-binding protein [Chitinophagales bacterium]MDW8273142.1 ATP-binding protein [Chitinophagales bacterium]
MSASDILKVAIVGPESTGKSNLSAALAKHFNTLYVPEMSRVYLEKLQRKWTYEDVLHIAQLQVQKEDELLPLANRFLFCDTELICIKVWLDYYRLPVPEWIIASIYKRKYHLFLLMNIDLPWSPDPLRENPHDRDILLHSFVTQLQLFEKPYVLISGNPSERFVQALQAINILEKSIGS